MVDFTTVVAVDEEHLAELAITLPTWQKNKPDVLQKLWVLRDPEVTTDAILEATNGLAERILDIPQGEFESHRHRMLNSFLLVSQNIETPWMLKLDTDTYATAPGPLIKRHWLDRSAVNNKSPAFVTQTWGYTKPAEMLDRLDYWAGRLGIAAKRPERQVFGNIAKSRRIISWFMLANVEWMRAAGAICSWKLPVPSQDTYCWYVAEMLGSTYVRANVKSLGWGHGGNLRVLQERAAKCLI